MQHGHLAERFLSHLSTEELRATWARERGLEESLRAAWEQGRTPWPEVNLEAGAFLAHVAERWPTDAAPDPHLGALNLADLYLVCAYLSRCAGAAEALERGYLAQVPLMIASMNLTQAQRESALDLVREKMLLPRAVSAQEPSPGVADAGHPAPGLAGYSGRGPLLGWLRVIAVRTTLNLLDRAEHRLHADEEHALRQIGQSPELHYVKGLDLRSLETAIKAAFAALDSTQRTLLRLHYVDGLNLEQIGLTFGVDKSTISRRIKAARESVAKATRRRLCEQLQLSPQDVESLIGFINSHLDIRLSGVLKG